MNFCLHYNKKSKNINNAEEIIIKNTGNLVDTIIKKYPNKIINIETAPILKQDLIKLQNKNIKLRLSLPIDKEFCKECKELGIKFYYNIYVNNWDSLLALKELGVSDIIIVEELGFELDKIKKILDNINIRCFPNVAQKNKEFEYDLGIKTFFIRPEDLNIYSEYIDIIEFYGKEDREDILFDIYKEEKWLGKLNEIIIDLKSDINSMYIIPRFAEKRIKCNRECLKGGICQMCNRIEELSYTLKDKGLIVKNKEV